MARRWAAFISKPPAGSGDKSNKVAMCKSLADCAVNGKRSSAGAAFGRLKTAVAQRCDLRPARTSELNCCDFPRGTLSDSHFPVFTAVKCFAA